MEITFKSTKLGKVFNSANELNRKFGAKMSKTIQMRMALLKSAPTLADLPTTPPPRRHQLTQDRDEQFAVDLVQPQRLVFEVDHDPIPRNEDDGINLTKVTAIRILEVIDYH
ncbi:system killer suppression protein [Mesorhizobium marinum]|uniref:system killer suppression protein n=1 Tax=Mesorhizobium marinum TaxID=3228790 RepID=UPI003467EC6C